ncbi:Acetyltransferase (GNAT) family protein [Niabella drilacis]|uniref:Acetyltransferase (GNAT) family protein n=2 Tax=Niabella drilacis (strain DSM 25811 / CCM 8410 / CCUG 62505 / LMG 26954 / E90) TaxID=1285928 RepID=A0A1G6SGQ6_NIADE|nr:Acetyltransferase (GNAT) family protein [Niabella drilacis]
MHYRKGSIADLQQLLRLGIEAWSGFEKDMAAADWQRLSGSIHSEQTYRELLSVSECLVCVTGEGRIVGMVFLVPQGNPTDLYPSDWSYIRFLTVSPDFGGRGIGRKLTEDCIAWARRNGETVVALHTSEMMSNARRLYEHLGFSIVREIEQRLGKRYWLYKLEL